MATGKEDAAFRYLEAKRRYQLRYMNAAVAMAIGGLSIAVALLFVLKDDAPSDRIVRASETTPKQSQYDTLEAQFVQFRAETQAGFQLISKAPSDRVEAAELSKLSAQVTALDSRLARLEAALASSPDRALALPLMRKELDSMSTRLAEHRSVAVVEVDRLYQVLLWVLGLLATLTASVVGGLYAFWKTSPNGGEDVLKAG